MAMTRQKYKNDCIILSTIEDLVPKDHLVRKIDAGIDFTFIEELVKDLYSIAGRPSIPPIVLFKLIFINILFGINSMRRMNLYQVFRHIFVDKLQCDIKGFFKPKLYY